MTNLDTFSSVHLLCCCSRWTQEIRVHARLCSQEASIIYDVFITGSSWTLRQQSMCLFSRGLLDLNLLLNFADLSLKFCRNDQHVMHATDPLITLGRLPVLRYHAMVSLIPYFLKHEIAPTCHDPLT